MDMNETQATCEKYPLDSKKIIKKTLSFVLGVIFLLIIAVPLVGMAIGYLTALSVGSIICLLICAMWYQYQRTYFKMYFYDITSEYARIKKGVYAPTEITIPYNRIQDVNVDQDFFDKLFGLYDVHLSNASSSSAQNAHIDGVTSDNAEAIRAKLLAHMHEKKNT